MLNPKDGIAFSRYTDRLQVTAWAGEDCKAAAVIMNETEEDIPFALKDMSDNELIETTSKAHSVMTVFYERQHI